MCRFPLLLLLLAPACFAARPSDYSTDMVMLQDSETIQTMKLYVSGQKSRVEGLRAGPLGRIVTISRKDRGVTWTLYLDQRQYSEKLITAGSEAGKPDLSNLDLTNLRNENLGRANVHGYACTKMRVHLGRLRNGQALVATVWVADALDLPMRLETMGIVQENRNLRVAAQHAGLFEIPAGFTRTARPGMPAAASDWTREYSNRLPAPGRNVASSSAGPAWTANTNFPGGDYRTIDMATEDPTDCKAACDQDARCRAWTLVKPGEPGGMGYCWLKDSIPPATAEDCCISGLKGGGSGGARTAARSSRYKLEMNTNRFGEDYHDFIPTRPSADLCAESCARDSRCRAWTWVKNDLEPDNGHCWLKNKVPEPTPDECCVSGTKRNLE